MRMPISRIPLRHQIRRHAIETRGQREREAGKHGQQNRAESGARGGSSETPFNTRYQKRPPHLGHGPAPELSKLGNSKWQLGRDS
jgi:hypothetical protein